MASTIKMNVNQLQQTIAAEVKDLLKLPDGSNIEVRFKADTTAPEAGGEINIRFSMPGAKPARVRKLTGAQEGLGDDAVLILGALKDAYEKNKQPFVALRWFKTKYLPALGINLQPDELNDLILKLVAQGALILEKVPNRNNLAYDVTTVRTPDMPPPKTDMD